MPQQLDPQAEQRIHEMEELSSLYREVFCSAKGMLVLVDMQNRHWYHRSTFSENARALDFREGQRHVVLEIMTLMQPYNRTDERRKAMMGAERRDPFDRLKGDES